jgi:hypothetical protein
MALIEMYLAGVSVRRVEDITEALWGTRVSPSTVSDLNKKIYGTIETWRQPLPCWKARLLRCRYSAYNKSWVPSFQENQRERERTCRRRDLHGRADLLCELFTRIDDDLKARSSVPTSGSAAAWTVEGPAPSF